MRRERKQSAKVWQLGGFLLAGIAGVVGTRPAMAGVVDSPLPVLQAGASTQHVFTIPGVIKNNNLETMIICTSLDPLASIVLGVEVFAAAGGPPLNIVSTPSLDGAESVGPGGTATITTGSLAGFHEDEIIDVLAPASLKNGSARVVSTSKKIACSAFVVDELNDPATTMGALSVLSKAKQKGD